MHPHAESAAAGEPRLFLSTQPATTGEARIAWTGILFSAVLFVLIAPFATMQLWPVPAFIPAYESALVICDLITAALLFTKFRVLRSGALLVIASGYVFTAFIAFAHALSFP